MPNAPLSKSSAELGSGAGATAPVVIVIVSTKKSHPFTPACGVVKVTEVIGLAAFEASEILPNALVDEVAGMPVNVFWSTNVAPENASTS